MQPSCLSSGPGTRRPRSLPVRAVAALCGVAAVSTVAVGGAARVVPASRPAGSAGCGTAAPAGSSTKHYEVQGHARLAIVHVPTGYTGKVPVALVLNLHGSQSTAAQQELFSGMDAVSDEDGFVLAYPQADIPEAGGFDWNVPDEPLVGGSYPPKGSANDDVFLATLVADLEARYCVNPLRVFATGMSGGARMASQLGCDESGVFAAIAPVAGLRFPSHCTATRAVPVIAFHGSADPIDPYAGNGMAYWTYSVPVAASRWATHDGCATRPKVVDAKGFTLTVYSGCASNASVRLYEVAGEGHEWPGGPVMPKSITRVLGPQSWAVSANTAMWAFFEAHPR